jgi:CRP-like cAMP-binding protein
VPLFAEAGDAAIDALTRAGRLCVFAKGKVIFEKGEPGDSLYLVVSGVVKVYVKDRILAYLKNGAYFGEMALVKKEPRMASVAALTDVEAFQIMKADFEAFLRSHGPAADALRRTIQQREQENLDLERHPERLERLRFLENLMGAHDILVIDLTRCVRCDKCVLACARARGQALFERKGDRFGGYLIATACRQCRDPACMLCKRGAIVRDKTGEIYIKETCIGCGFCAKQCPFGNIIIVEVEEPATHAGGGAEPPRVRKKAAKCDLCRHLDYPPCAFNCPTGALARLEPEEIFLKPTGAGKR